MPNPHARLAAALLCMSTPLPAFAQTTSPPAKAQETPLTMVAALHTAFGEHHARAVHTKGTILEGSFTPAPEAKSLTREPIFAGGTVPVIARFSLFAGLPDLPDNDDGASPAGFAVKMIAPDGDDFDIEANQHGNFIVATFDEFALFLRALGAAGKGDNAPLGAFLGSHPKAKAFLESRTYPASFSTAVYFGVNALKFTNAAGKSTFVRYRFVPKAGETYLSPEARKSAGPAYLGDDLRKRIAAGPIEFGLYAQVAGPGDVVDDPSTAWPDTRRLVKLGSFRLDHLPADPEAAQKSLLFLPGQVHPGVAPADPMLVMRNTAYPISLGQRQ
ncbi:catalase [Sphingomonas sp. KR3-1]|uniref:catalase n=1 Tax=Sphingomonas sp. KR3-1 TaxID=3156611 RepID=UPI0032B32E98